MRRGALLLIALLLGGCVYYPTVPDIGGIRIRPANGRAVVQPEGVAIYMDIENTGGYPDTMLGITSEVARSATLINVPGDKTGRLEVPAATTVTLKPDGAYIMLTDLSRPLRSGEVIILTLVFERVGRIGVITRVE
jgi:copper(I)-binding protein